MRTPRRRLDDDAIIDALTDHTTDDNSEDIEAELWSRLDREDTTEDCLYRCICASGPHSEIRLNRGCDLCIEEGR